MKRLGKPAELLEVRALPHDRRKGLLRFGPITVPCALGRSGIVQRKHEGDGTTPAGCFQLVKVFYRPDRGPRLKTGLPVTALTSRAGWCDDPGHRLYNRPVTLPFPKSHEIMWRDDPLYDIVVVLDYNLAPAVRGRGSAIFFHIARPHYTPTEGCVAVAPRHMRLLLSKVRPGAAMRIHL